MTQASPARVEKLVGKKKAQAAKPHQNRSFDQLVSDAMLARLKPFIFDQVGAAAEQIAQSIYKMVLSEKAMTQTRQLAFELLLKENCPWFNDDVLSMAVARVEDDSAGRVLVDDEAKPGDNVRVEFQARRNDAGDFSEVQKLAIHALGQKGRSGTVQSNSEEFETALVGMKTGETKEFLIPEEAEEGKEPENTRVRVTVKRISRVPAPIAPAGEIANV